MAILDLIRRKKVARHLVLGQWGERIAKREAKRNGIKILGTNVRIGKHDEIDILGREGLILVIIEVKTRATDEWSAPIDAVDYEKRYHLSRAAVRYAKGLHPRPDAIRFDVVEVIGQPAAGKPEVRYHHSAFGLDRRFRW